MPNTKSAIKALRQSVKRRSQNIRRKTAYRAALKEVKKLIASAHIAEAEKLVPKIYQTLDKAAKTMAIKKNKASRLKSRIVKAIKRSAAA
ncbi:MAG: 30S ribosomal protein S20 [Candidatus Sungbacteria bacterium]|nr:30S ribosomal protein S20 [Candidatus Sungbacteria bacterium]